jgi:ribosomal protein L40E
MFKRLTNRILNSVEDVVVREATKALAPHIQDAAEDLMDSIFNAPPQVRSAGGGTSVYMTRVKQDFNDFHAEDADTDIQTFILELLQIKYCGKEGFEKAKVSDKVAFNLGDKTTANLSAIKINSMSVADYQKSLNSATIRYRVSIGFNVNGVREEKLYEVEYTLQLRNEFEAQTFLACQNCGAVLPESNGVCRYCGMKHIRDTITHWVIMDYKEK